MLNCSCILFCELVDTNFHYMFFLFFVVWSTPVIDVQMSPKKALHAAMQLRRYRDTILKAKQKMYLDHVSLCGEERVYRL